MIFPPSGIAIDAPFARLFGQLACDRFTGALDLADGGRHYTLGWRSGQIVEGVSASPEDTFGRIALEAGMCTASQVGESVQRLAQSPGRRQPSLLIEMGALDPADVERVERMALSRRARRLFAFPEATYTTSVTAPTREEGGPIEPRWVLIRGVRKYFSDERLENEIGGLAGTAVRLAVDAQGLEGYAFAEEDRTVLNYLGKGYWEAPDLIAACNQLPRGQVLSALLALFAFGDLDVKPAASVPRLRKRGRTPSAPLHPSAVAPAAHRQMGAAAPAPFAAPVTTSMPALPAPGPASPASTTPRPQAKRATLDNPTPPAPTKRATLDSPTPPATPGLREQILAKQAQIDAGADHFVVLDLDRAATTDQVKNAYFKLAKIYHPDRLVLVHLDDLRPQVERIFARLGEAFGILGDDARRREFLSRGDGKQADEASHAANRALSAEDRFRKGEMALRRQQFALAIDEFRAAIELRPDEAEHHALLGWATFCATADKDRVYTEARKHVLHALELNRDCLPAHFYLGQLYKHKGEMDRAAAHFQRVLDSNERHLEAARELRLIQMRKAAGSKGLFDRFKKK